MYGIDMNYIPKNLARRIADASFSIFLFYFILFLFLLLRIIINIFKILFLRPS